MRIAIIDAVLDDDAIHVIKNNTNKSKKNLLFLKPIIFSNVTVQAIAVTETKPIEFGFLNIPVKYKSWKPLKYKETIINKNCIKIQSTNT